MHDCQAFRSARSSHSLVQSLSFQEIKETRQLPIAPTRFVAQLSVSFSPETLAEAGLTISAARQGPAQAPGGGIIPPQRELE